MHRIAGALCLAVVLGGALAGNVLGQPQPMMRAQDLDLIVPVGREAFEVTDRNVLVPVDDEDAGRRRPVVASVFVEVGNRYIVKMPDGALRSIVKRDTTATDRKFEPMDKDDLSDQLKQQFKGFRTKSTRRYLCVYNTTEAFCERQLAILETMYPMLYAYFKRQRLKVYAPETPLVLVMFRTKKEFQEFRKVPDSMLAYFNAVNNRVYLYQFSEIAKDAPLIAAKQATSTIAHEGVHQILHNIGVQKPLSDWPIWLSEGLAEYFAPTSTSRARWSGVGKPNDLRMRELFMYLNRTPGVGDGSMVRNLVLADQLGSTEYAIAWALTHYLATKRKNDLFAYLREVSDVPPLELQDDPLEQFTKHFGDRFSEIEREMLKHLRGLEYSDPVLNQPYFLITAKTAKRKMATITTSLDHASVQREMVSKLPLNERVKLRFYPVRPFPNRLMAEQAAALFTR